MPITALKTATYAVTHFCVAIGVAYALTGDLAIAMSVGLIEPIVQTLFYNLHEKAWAAESTRRLRF